MNRPAHLDRLAAIEVEYRFAALSVNDLRARVRADPTRLRRERLTLTDVDACSGNLEATYVIRLFAEFEVPLRLYWRDVRRRRRTWQTIGAQDLIERAATYLRVPDQVRREAQEVREFRNSLVHRAAAHPASPLPLRHCYSCLRHFLSRLPVWW